MSDFPKPQLSEFFIRKGLEQTNKSGPSKQHIQSILSAPSTAGFFLSVVPRLPYLNTSMHSPLIKPQVRSCFLMTQIMRDLQVSSTPSFRGFITLKTSMPLPWTTSRVVVSCFAHESRGLSLSHNPGLSARKRYCHNCSDTPLSLRMQKILPNILPRVPRHLTK